MKAFLKTYWLEFLFFAVGLVGAAVALPFLPGSLPRQWNNGQVVSTMPKLCLLLVPVIQLAVTMTVRAVLGAQMKKSPALAGVPRVLSAVVAVVCLVLEACILLTAWGASLPVEGVLLAALVLGGLCVLAAPIACMLRDMKRGG